MNISEKQNKVILPSSVYTVKAEEFNQIVKELQHIIDTAEITKSAADTTQLYQALQSLFSVFTSLQINDNNGTNIKTQSERNREYEAALAGGVTLAYPEGYIYGGQLTYNSTSLINIAASACRSSDDTKNIFVSANSLNITTSSNWASGSVPASLASLKIYIWSVYNSGSSKYLFDDSTGSNISGQKQLIAKLKTNTSSEILSYSLVDFSMDINSCNARTSPDYTESEPVNAAGQTMLANGYIKAIAEGGDDTVVTLVINGEAFPFFYTVGAISRDYLLMKVNKGDIVSASGSAGFALTFFPCRGNI